jgi:dTDP-4-amino-4,6-dideoxygalactose transaminase
VFDQEQIDAAAEVLRSGRVNYWTGDQGRAFEREFAEITGIAHAVFVANGTVGLEAAIEALDLPVGAQVVTTPRTFIASSSAIIRNGLRPVFADVELDSGNISASSIKDALTPETRAVLVVHLGGWPADMHEIRRLCDERSLVLIEDCSQAHGAMVSDRHVGAFADVSVWSFCQDKIITTGGEGGMVATNDDALGKRIWSLKDHGKSWDAVYQRDHPPGFRWLHESFGSNFRGTEIEAALGRIQYGRLDAWRAERTANAALLSSKLSDIDCVRIAVPDETLTHAYYRLYAYLDLDALGEGWTRDRVLEKASALQPIPVLSGSCSEIYREVAFVGTESVPTAPLPNAHTLSATAMAFLVHPGLAAESLDGVATALRTVLADATTTEYR